MNSKEALDNLVHCKSEAKCKECRIWYRCTMERDYNTIKQDLERKEQLEKENQELKNEWQDLMAISVAINQENEMLRNAIEILKDKSKLILKNDNGYYIECGKYGYLDLTEQEYELLKEVLENENNFSRTRSF